MFKILGVLFAFILLHGMGSCSVAFAQSAIENPPSAEELMAFVAALGGVKGMATLPLTAIVVQGAMLLIRSSLGELIGKYKLLALYGLSLVGTAIGLKIADPGLSPILIFLHGNVLAAMQLLGHQAYKQFAVKKD